MHVDTSSEIVTPVLYPDGNDGVLLYHWPSRLFDILKPLNSLLTTQMAFRKRTTGISHTSGLADTVLTTSNVNPLGVRPSPVDGRPTTSTGTPSLDSLLAGHAGLALGTSLLIEETGTSDYAGALLRYYAAEGIVQGHKIHVVGMREQWGRELPRVVGRVGEENSGNDGGRTKKEAEKMKIAWRYDGMGEFGTGTGNRGAWPTCTSLAISESVVHIDKTVSSMDTSCCDVRLT